MEPEWRAGLVSVLQLSRDYGVSRAGIIKHWDKEGVERDLLAKIQARAEALVTHDAVTPKAVSYTHLDVYKRQAWTTEKATKMEGSCNDKLACQVQNKE